MMTKKQLEESLIFVLGIQVYNALIKVNTPLPRIVNLAGMELFLNQPDKCTHLDASRIRQQLNNLEHKGQFIFDSE